MGLILVAVSFVSAQAQDINAPVNDVISSQSSSKSTSSPKSQESNGGSLKTFYYHNGEACVKKDLYIRYVARKDTPINPKLVGKVKILGDYANAPGYEWRIRIIEGDNLPARDIMTGRLSHKAECIVSGNDDPVPYNWFTHKRIKTLNS